MSKSIFDSLKSPACQAGGFLLGVTLMKAVNKIVNSDTVSGILGDDTASTFKQYLTPVIVCAGGLFLGNRVYDENLKDACNGIAVSGAVDLGMELLYKKNLLSGTGCGLLGSILGDEDVMEGDGEDSNFEEYQYAEPAEVAVNPAISGGEVPTIAAIGEIPGLTMDGIGMVGGGIM